MFIPMFGAYVRGQHYPTSLVEIARVGLAGPIWGMGAALACYALYLATDNILWGALAQTGAILNLLNMMPVWQLDGAAGFMSLTRGQRLLASAASGALLMFTVGDGHWNIFLLLITLFGLGKSFFGEMPARRDDYGLFQYVMLLIVLGMLATLQLPGVHF
jgi:Zn-dependent protease